MEICFLIVPTFFPPSHLNGFHSVTGVANLPYYYTTLLCVYDLTVHDRFSNAVRFENESNCIRVNKLESLVIGGQMKKHSVSRRLQNRGTPQVFGNLKEHHVFGCFTVKPPLP